MKKMRLLAVSSVVIAAAAVMTSTISAGSLSSQRNITSLQSSYLQSVQEEESGYITPMTTDKSSERYKSFVGSSPLITNNRVRGYDTSISWSPVEDALLYYVYYKRGSSYSLVGKTSETSYSAEDNGKYYVRAVTYDYNDRIIFSKRSKIVDVEKKYYYDWYYDYEVEEAASEAETNYSGTYSQEKSLVSEPTAYINDGLILPDNEEYTHYDIDGFKKASDTPLSTFSADVDTASFANIRRMARDNRFIDNDAVRIEEFLNYFDYNYTQPKKGTFSLTYEYTDCPWNSKAKLLMMGIQTKEPETEPSSNLVFLIDVSGSMYSKDKLPLVVDSLKKLSREMTKDDRISIVTYSGKEKVIVSGAYGNMKNCIADLCDTLVAYGCTNGERGINMAYEIAAENYIKDGNNRVIMATDGDLNVGISSKDDLATFIADKRESGVYLSILGVGTGNLKDDRMEALAKEGNGNYSYIDCAEEATKVLVEERVKNLVTVADDTKIQVEFNPMLIDSYRLIGYDGRRLNNEDFANDAKDAADMGAGQSITVMYEIIPASGAANTLTYQTSTGNTSDLCKVRIRFKKPGETGSKQSVFTLKKSEYLKYSKTGIRFRFASCVAEAAMSLRDEKIYGDVSLENARARFEKLDAKELEAIGYSGEFADLLEMLKSQ